MKLTADNWQAIGSVVVFIIIGGYGAWQSRKAKKYAEPTGNGFAKYVKDSLATLQEAAAESKAADLEQKQVSDRIEARQVQSDSILYNHITAHANADVLRGSRSDAPSDPNTP